MNTFPFKKVTIIAERLLRESVLKLLRAEGSTGHTLIAVEGAGSRGVHATDFEGRNVQIETIVPDAVAHRILARIDAEFLENYAVIAYLSDVAVLRRGKFGNESPGPGQSDPNS